MSNLTYRELILTRDWLSNLTYRGLILTWAECQIWPTGTWYLREQIVKSDLQGLDTDESRMTNLTYKELILTWAECQIWPPDVPTWNPPWPWLSVSVYYSSSGNANLLQAPPEVPQLILFLHCHLRSWKNSQTQNFNKTYKLRYLNFFYLDYSNYSNEYKDNCQQHQTYYIQCTIFQKQSKGIIHQT